MVGIIQHLNNNNNKYILYLNCLLHIHTYGPEQGITNNKKAFIYDFFSSAQDIKKN